MLWHCIQNHLCSSVYNHQNYSLLTLLHKGGRYQYILCLGTGSFFLHIRTKINFTTQTGALPKQERSRHSPLSWVPPLPALPKQERSRPTSLRIGPQQERFDLMQSSLVVLVLLLIGKTLSCSSYRQLSCSVLQSRYSLFLKSVTSIWVLWTPYRCTNLGFELFMHVSIAFCLLSRRWTMPHQSIFGIFLHVF